MVNNNLLFHAWMLSKSFWRHWWGWKALPYILVSSASMEHVLPTDICKSEEYSKINSGSKTELRGKSLVMSSRADIELSTLTLNVLLVKKADIQSRTQPRIKGKAMDLYYVNSFDKVKTMTSTGKFWTTSWVKSLTEVSSFVATDFLGEIRVAVFHILDFGALREDSRRQYYFFCF